MSEGNKSKLEIYLIAAYKSFHTATRNVPSLAHLNRLVKNNVFEVKDYEILNLAAYDSGAVITPIDKWHYATQIKDTLNIVHSNPHRLVHSFHDINNTTFIIVQAKYVLSLDEESSDEGRVKIYKLDLQSNSLECIGYTKSLFYYEYFDNNCFSAYNRNFEVDKDFVYVSCRERRASTVQAIGCIPIAELDRIASAGPVSAENASTVRMSLLRTNQKQYPEHFCLADRGLVFVLSDKGEVTPFRRNKLSPSEFLSSYEANEKSDDKFDSWSESNLSMFDKLESFAIKTGLDGSRNPVFTCVASCKNEILVSCEASRSNSTSDFVDIKFYLLRFNRNRKLDQLHALDVLTQGGENCENPKTKVYSMFKINPHSYRGANLWYCFSIHSKMTILCSRGVKLHLLVSPKDVSSTWINSTMTSENNRSLLICCQIGLHKCNLPK